MKRLNVMRSKDTKQVLVWNNAELYFDYFPPLETSDNSDPRATRRAIISGGIHTQNSESTGRSCTQYNRKVHKRVQGGYTVHFLAIAFDSHRYLRKKKQERESVLYQRLSPACAHTSRSPLPPTLLHKQKEPV